MSGAMSGRSNTRGPRNRSLKSKITAGIRGITKTSNGGSTSSSGGVQKSDSGTHVGQRPNRHQGVTANQTIMPYLIVVQDGTTIELKGSVDGLASSHLFSKLGMDQLICAKKKADLTMIKIDYFNVLEHSGFYLVSSSACSAEGRIVREYLFRRQVALKRTSLADAENKPSNESRGNIWKLRHSSCEESGGASSSRCPSPDDELFVGSRGINSDPSSPRSDQNSICMDQVTITGTPLCDPPTE